ncbi:MAG: SdrD B-like domain-containing protein [Culicoidibacterales bacterium]
MIKKLTRVSKIIISFTILLSMVHGPVAAQSRTNSQATQNQVKSESKKVEKSEKTSPNEKAEKSEKTSPNEKVEKSEKTSLNEKVEKSEKTSLNEKAETTQKNDDWRIITASNFDVNIGEQQNLTPKSVLEKAKASIDGETKGININEKDLENLKSATNPGLYKIWLESQTLKKEVTVELVEKKERAIKLNQADESKVNISIPGYSATKGLLQEDIYDVVINVDFGLNPSQNKKVNIVLPEGMRYTAVPVTNDYKDIFVPANSTLGGFIQAVERPKNNIIYDSFNGLLTYQFTEGVTKVEITGIKVTVDGSLYYGPKVFKNGISATALVDEVQIGNDTKEISAVGEVNYYTNTVEWKKNLTVIEGDANNISAGYVELFKGGERKRSYIKKATMVYSYPKQAKVKRVSGTSNIAVVDDEVNAILTYTIPDLKGRPIISVEYGLGHLSQGTYLSDGKGGKYTIETYDGTIIENKQLDMATEINVLGATDPRLNNRSRLDIYASSFDDIDSTYLTKVPIMRIINDTTLNSKKRQVIEIEADSTYEGYAISMPEFAGTTVSEIEYKTNLGKVGIATGKQIETTQTTKDVNARRITRSSVGLQENEYFIYGRTLVGDIPEGKASGDLYGSDTQTLFMLGRLKAGANTAKVTLRSWSDKEGQKEVGSENEVSRTLSRAVTKIEYYDAAVKDISLEAGKSVEISGELGINAIYFSPTIGLKDPIIYLRVPQEFEIAPDSISVTQDGKNVVSELKSAYPIANGERGIAIHVQGKTGVSFDETSKRQSKFAYKYTLKASDRASGNYNFSDLIFFEATREFSPAVKDIYDLKGNGKQNLLGRINSGKLSVQERKVLLVDTFIQPEGESKRPIYDPTKPETAVGFTPGTRADYTVDILNNGNSVGKNVQIYLPIPRVGNDFGSDFQRGPFKWNMKQDTARDTFKVLDEKGQDITAAKAGDYKIEYSNDATTKANYETATYRTTPSQTDTMIRVTNTTGIGIGERVLLVKNYIVDETLETITAFPERLGAINDFRPYYRFEAGSVGAQHGTAVGTALMIGEISGIIFNDEATDGIFNKTEDNLLKDREITLYKKVDNTYQKQTTTKSQEDGSYKFSGLTNGLYRVDFNSAKINNKEEFTLKGRGGNPNLDSDVNFLGVDKGLVSEIDPTAATAKEITAGLIAYDAATEFTNTASAKEVNLLASNAQKTSSTTVSTAISPKKFEQIQATNNPITWNIADQNIASVSSTGNQATIIAGQTKGRNETTSIEVIATDMYTNQAKETIKVNILSNDIPVATNLITSIEAGTVVTNSLLASLVTIDDTEDGKLEVRMNSQIPLNNQNRAMITGKYLVEYTATDKHGNSIIHKANIDIVDTTNPILMVTNNTRIISPEKIAVPQNWNQVFGISATDNIDGILTEKITYENDVSLTSMNKPGLYKIKAKVADRSNNEITRDLQLLITDKSPNNNEIIDANNFAIKLSEVNNANYITRASARAYSTEKNDVIEEITKINIDTQIRPTSVGVYKITFSTENKTMVTVDMVVIADDLNPNITEIITGNSFSLKLSEVKTANYNTLSKVQGHDITDPNQVQKIEVTVVDAIRPTVAGLYPLIFKTVKGTIKNVDMLVLPENHLETTQEVVSANNFSLKLAEVQGADLQQLATAIGHDITDPLNIKRIPLNIIDEIKPIKEGLYPVTFSTEKGATKVIQMLVLSDELPPTAKDTITANSFSLKISEVENANYLSLSQAKGHDITDPLNIKPLEVEIKTDLRPDKAGAYEIILSLESGTQKTITMLVVPNELPTTVKEIVNANNFSILLKDVGAANYFQLANATGFNIENPLDIKSLELKIETEIRPTNIGNYPITFRTNNGTRKTVDMLIIPDALPAETLEIITAKAFKINLKEVAAADYISLASAVGHNISNPSDIVRIDILVENNIRPEKKGSYQIIFVTEKGTRKVVDMIVVDDEIIPEDREILLANSFSIKLNEIENANYVELSMARAYNAQTMEPVNVSIKTDIRPTTAGDYTITLRTEKGTEQTITMLVLENDIVIPQTKEIIEADDFTIKLSEAAQADYLILAQAQAFDITNENDIKAVDLRVETTTRPTTVGVHKIIFTTEKGTKKEISMIITENTIPSTGVEYISANDFSIKLSEVAQADYLKRANARGYYVENDGKVTNINVSIKTDIRPTTAGDYTITLRTEKGTEQTITMLVLENDIVIPQTKEIIEADNFTIKLSEAAQADYLILAQAQAFDITNENNIKAVDLRVETTTRPTTVGVHKIIFTTEKGTKKEISMVVIDTEQPTGGIKANDFILQLKDVKTANYVKLANAYAYYIDEFGTVQIPQVEVETDIRPQKPGDYKIIFTTAMNDKIEVTMTIIADFLEAETEIIVGNPFLLKSAEVANADYAQHANIKAYRKTEQGNIENIAVQIKKDIRPTKTGIYGIIFYTASGIQKNIDMIVQEEKDEAETEVIQANDFIIEVDKVPTTNFISKANARAYDVSDNKNVKLIKVMVEDTFSLAAGFSEVGQGVYKMTFITDGGAQTTVKSIVSLNAPVENQVAVANHFSININDLEKVDLVKSAGAQGYESDGEENIKEIPVKLLGLRPTTIGNHTITFATEKNAKTEVTVTVLSTFVNYIELTGNNIELDSANIMEAIQQGNVKDLLIKEAGIIAKYHTEKSITDLPILIDEEQLINVGTVGTHDIEIIARAETDDEIETLNMSTSEKKTLEKKIIIQLKTRESNPQGPILAKTGDRIQTVLLLSIILLLTSVTMLVASRRRERTKGQTKQ